MNFEKTFGTVPREMVMATVRRLGVSAGVRMAEVMYERTKGRVVFRHWMSDARNYT